jgi:hypothetical protein
MRVTDGLHRRVGPDPSVKIETTPRTLHLKSSTPDPSSLSLDQTTIDTQETMKCIANMRVRDKRQIRL